MLIELSIGLLDEKNKKYMISLFQYQNYQHFVFLKVYTFLLLVSFSSSGHILDSIPNFDPPKMTF
jgi:hypothetical protein